MRRINGSTDQPINALLFVLCVSVCFCGSLDAQSTPVFGTGFTLICDDGEVPVFNGTSAMWECGAGGGEGGTPGGPDGQAQYRVNASTFGGFPLLWNGTLMTFPGSRVRVDADGNLEILHGSFQVYGTGALSVTIGSPNHQGTIQLRGGNTAQIAGLDVAVLMRGNASNAPEVVAGIQAPVATARGLIIQGAESQSANLLDFRNSAGDFLTGFDPAGNFSGNVSGNAATATALESTPVLCDPGDAARGVDEAGDAAGCFTPPVPSAADESTAGVAEIATQAEVNAGTDDARIVTPEKFAASAQLNARLLAQTLGCNARTQLTLDMNGDLALTNGCFSVDTFEDASSDAYDGGGSCAAGTVAVLMQENAGRDVVLDSASMQVVGATDQTLNQPGDMAFVSCPETNTPVVWHFLDQAGEIRANSLAATGEGSNVFAYDVETAGNDFTTVDEITFMAGLSRAGTAASGFHLPASGAPAETSVAGSNTIFATLAFDADADESVQGNFRLPAGWGGTVGLLIKWRAAATTDNVAWDLETTCIADAEVLDAAFQAAQEVVDAAKGTTLQTNDASIASVTMTGCAAGELFAFRFSRDADDATNDTMSGDAELISLTFTLRRTL